MIIRPSLEKQDYLISLNQKRKALNITSIGLVVIGILTVVFGVAVMIRGHSIFPKLIETPTQQLIDGGSVCFAGISLIGVCHFTFRCAEKVRRYIDLFEKSPKYSDLTKEHNSSIQCQNELRALTEPYRDLFLNDKVSIDADEDWFYFKNFKTYTKEDADFSKTLDPMYVHVEQNLQELAKEYKIHFMPKGEHAFAILGILFEKIASDKNLRAIIKEVKISKRVEGEVDDSGNVPVIVVYLKLGKENAESALDSLVKHFTPFFSCGSGTCPRFNCKGNNPLIFYAQGDSYHKALLKLGRLELFEKLYESDGAHFDSKFGNFKLCRPRAF